MNITSDDQKPGWVCLSIPIPEKVRKPKRGYDYQPIYAVSATLDLIFTSLMLFEQAEDVGTPQLLLVSSFYGGSTVCVYISKYVVEAISQTRGEIAGLMSMPAIAKRMADFYKRLTGQKTYRPRDFFCSLTRRG